MLPVEALRILIQEKFGTFPYFLICALLECLVIILLLLDGFLSFLSNEFARLFELKTPCLLCTRLDHLIFPRDSNSYFNDSVCEVHKKDLCTLTYCHLHKRLSDIRTMCQGCLLAFSDKDSDSDKHISAITSSAEDEQKPHLKKDEMEIVADMCRCSCCGEPMKLKSTASPTQSPRAPLFSVINDEDVSMDLLPDLIQADTVFELQEVEFSDSHGGEEAKALTVSLPEIKEMSEDAPVTPTCTSRNMFFGTALTDSGPISPNLGSRVSKKPPEKPEVILELITKESEGEGDVLTRLKRQVSLDHKSLTALYMELDEERSASAVAANNAMAMITRLQAEKAAVQMEALQYQRMMEEQAEYDEEELETVKDMVSKREEEVKALEEELHMYREKYGVIKQIGSEICEVDFDDDYQDIRSQALSSSSEKSDSLEAYRNENEHAQEQLEDCSEGIPNELELDCEGERSHLLGLMREVEKKMLHSASEEASSSSSSSFYPAGNGENKAVLTRDVSLISERLIAVEAESGFLKHAAMTLQRGEEGMRVLSEIAEHLRKLRQSLESPSEEKDA